MKEKPARSNVRMRDNPRLEMTSMIDVVFLLLIFFIVSLRPEDVLSRMEVSRPTSERTETLAEGIVDIIVGKGSTGFVLNGRSLSRQELDRDLGRLAAVDPTVPVAIKCMGHSRHQRLVEVLDICAKYGLTGLSVHSL